MIGGYGKITNTLQIISVANAIVYVITKYDAQNQVAAFCAPHSRKTKNACQNDKKK